MCSYKKDSFFIGSAPAEPFRVLILSATALPPSLPGHRVTQSLRARWRGLVACHGPGSFFARAPALAGPPILRQLPRGFTPPIVGNRFQRLEGIGFPAVRRFLSNIAPSLDRSLARAAMSAIDITSSGGTRRLSCFGGLACRRTFVSAARPQRRRSGGLAPQASSQRDQDRRAWHVGCAPSRSMRGATAPEHGAADIFGPPAAWWRVARRSLRRGRHATMQGRS